MRFLCGARGACVWAIAAILCAQNTYASETSRVELTLDAAQVSGLITDFAVDDEVALVGYPYTSPQNNRNSGAVAILRRSAFPPFEWIDGGLLPNPNLSRETLFGFGIEAQERTALVTYRAFPTSAQYSSGAVLTYVDDAITGYQFVGASEPFTYTATSCCMALDLDYPLFASTSYRQSTASNAQVYTHQIDPADGSTSSVHALQEVGVDGYAQAVAVAPQLIATSETLWSPPSQLISTNQGRVLVYDASVTGGWPVVPQTWRPPVPDVQSSWFSRFGAQVAFIDGALVVSSQHAVYILERAPSGQWGLARLIDHQDFNRATKTDFTPGLLYDFGGALGIGFDGKIAIHRREQGAAWGQVGILEASDGAPLRRAGYNGFQERVTSISYENASTHKLVVYEFELPFANFAGGRGWAQTLEDTPVDVALPANDPGSNDPLMFTITTPPAHGSLSGSGAMRTYRPDQDFHGQDSFEFTATNTMGAVVSGFVEIEIEAVNDPPTLRSNPALRVLPTFQDLVIEYSDVDSSQLMFSLDKSTTPERIITTYLASGTSHIIRYDASVPGPATDVIEYTVADDQGATASGSLTVTIVPESLYFVSPADGQTEELELGETLELELVTDGLDLDAPVELAMSQPPEGALIEDGTFSWTPDAPGTTVLTFTATQDQLIASRDLTVVVSGGVEGPMDPDLVADMGGVSQLDMGEASGLDMDAVGAPDMGVEASDMSATSELDMERAPAADMAPGASSMDPPAPETSTEGGCCGVAHGGSPRPIVIVVSLLALVGLASRRRRRAGDSGAS